MKPAFAHLCARHFTLTFYLILAQVMWSRWYNFITGKLAQGGEIMLLLAHSWYVVKSGEPISGATQLLSI